MDKEKLNEKLIELQILSQQITEMDKYVQEIENKINNLIVSIQSLQEFKKQEKEDVLVPVVPGVFFKGKITNKEKVIINVGSNVVVEKSLNEAVELIEEQLKELEKYKNELIKELENMINKANQLQEEINKDKNVQKA